MPLQATSGAASYDAFGGGAAAVPNYIEDVFSTWLYTGTGSNGLQIQNGIDLAGKGGLVIGKARSGANAGTVDWGWIDTVRGGSSVLYSNTNFAAAATSQISSFNADGFTLNGAWPLNFYGSPYTYASWTFREQPKFFDIVTWSGNSVAGRQIPHGLGSTPGCVIIKSLVTDQWCVWHRGLTAGRYIVLNSTAAQTTSGAVNRFGDGSTTVDPTSTYFTVGTNGEVNQSGNNYVAYLFAHDAGGFGLTGTDNVISCGSFTTNGSGDASVTLGYEPQLVIMKRSNGAGNWNILDNMRGWSVSGSDAQLQPNNAGAEELAEWGAPNATGFTGNFAASSEVIYIAIRRGPMKVPTTGTSVFSPVSTSGNVTSITSGFPVDFALGKEIKNSTSYGNYAIDRLRGGAVLLETNTTGAEYTSQTFKFDSNTQFLQSGGGLFYGPSIYWLMRRAPGFMDVACFSGTGSARTVAHNLGVAPELMIVKQRSSGTATGWAVYTDKNGANQSAGLNLPDAFVDLNSAFWNSTAPTSTQFSVGTNAWVNSSGSTYVAYLFASCPGVSKVFNFTGNGSSQTINCGFTGGARFVMIKRTDSTGDWYVWDSARGIVAGNDPHLSLNTTAAEVTTNDTIDTDSTGFVVNQVSATNVNVNGASYIGLAIA